MVNESNLLKMEDSIMQGSRQVSNENGKMVKSDDIASLNETLSGTLVFIDNNTYVDLGMNEYIPVFDKETGDILLVTHNKECLNLKEDCGNNRSSLPVQLSVIQ